MLLLIFMILFSGCQNPEEPTTVPAGIAPSATHPPTPLPRNDETEIPTLEPKTPTAVATDSIEDELVDINCGEVFCQTEWPGYLQRPIGGEDRRTIDQSYPYNSNLGGLLEIHHGVEFPNPQGTPVLAAESGEVVFAGNDDLTVLGPYTGFYGNVIILRHPALFQERDLFTLYAHLSALFVQPGDRVDQGELIGEVGSTGAADGAHLHFEVRLDQNDYNKSVNPVLWFAPVTTQSTARTATIAGEILGRYGSPMTSLPVTIEKLGQDGAVVDRFYVETYIPSTSTQSHPVLSENFVLPDIAEGDYRLAFIAGRLYEVFFTLEPGSLGFVKLQLQ